MLLSLTCECSVWNLYWKILFGGRNNSKQLSLISERNACAVSSVGCNLSGLRREFHLVITPFNFINGPYKVQFGEDIAAAYALSNLIYIEDRVSGSSYCFVSSFYYPWLLSYKWWTSSPDFGDWVDPVVGPCTGSLMSWDHNTSALAWLIAEQLGHDAARSFNFLTQLKKFGYLPWRTSPMVFESPFPFLKQF